MSKNNNWSKIIEIENKHPLDLYLHKGCRGIFSYTSIVLINKSKEIYIYNIDQTTKQDIYTRFSLKASKKLEEGFCIDYSNRGSPYARGIEIRKDPDFCLFISEVDLEDILELWNVLEDYT